MRRLQPTRLLALKFVAAVALTTAGCSESAGTSSPPDAGLGGNGGNAGAGGAGGVGGAMSASCGEGFLCVPDPGPAWSGPVALADSDDGCSGTFPSEAAAAFEGLVPGDAACTCTCEGLALASCSTRLFVVGFADSLCGDAQGQEEIEYRDCYNTFSQSHSLISPPATTNCPPGEVTPDLPTATWTSGVSVCDGFTPGVGTCDAGESCVPSPSFGLRAGFCYFQAGDHDCPGDFANKQLLHSRFTDTRGCPSQCNCRSGGAVCSTLVRRYPMPNCAGDALEPISLLSDQEQCVAPFSSTTQSFWPLGPFVQEDGACMPTALSPTGEIIEDGTTTFCCN
jgi:hypothetical protein